MQVTQILLKRTYPSVQVSQKPGPFTAQLMQLEEQALQVPVEVSAVSGTQEVQVEAVAAQARQLVSVQETQAPSERPNLLKQLVHKDEVPEQV